MDSSISISSKVIIPFRCTVIRAPSIEPKIGIRTWGFFSSRACRMQWGNKRPLIWAQRCVRESSGCVQEQSVQIYLLTVVDFCIAGFNNLKISQKHIICELIFDTTSYLGLASRVGNSLGMRVCMRYRVSSHSALCDQTQWMRKYQIWVNRGWVQETESIMCRLEMWGRRYGAELFGLE